MASRVKTVATELRTVSLEPSSFQARSDTVVSWLGMAGALINSHGTVLLVDPLLTVIMKDGKPWSDTPHPFKIDLPIQAKDIPRVDAVLYPLSGSVGCVEGK